MMDISAKYNRSDFIDFLSNSFLPEDFQKSNESIVIDRSHSKIKTVEKLGYCPSLDVSVYEFKHESINDPRVTLSRESFKIIEANDTSSNALAVFYSDTENWRLSLITSDYTTGKTNKQVKRNFSNPRRYSYLLGEECKRHTPESMLITKGKINSTEDLIRRFAVDVVTKEFYTALFRWYDDWAVNLVKFPVGKGGGAHLPQKPDVESNRQHLIRLITRLIFVWFIKQRGLIPPEIFNKNEVEKIFKSFDSESAKQGNYYNGIIQNLFFATLNKDIKERRYAEKEETKRKDDYSIKTSYRDFIDESLFKKSTDLVKMFESVPFLNGGLFECLDDFDTKEYIDGFSREKKRAAFVPNCLFWGNGEHEGIIPLLDRYNFTVEENTLQDIDIALDPELLGKVFENLLGTYNEETSSTARNELGAFYTPREIVEYMVDTSLKEYFKSKLDLEDIGIEDKLSKLFSYNEAYHDFNAKETKALIEAIHHCKIVDPACGSGAFPMGILNKLTFILGKLDPDNKQWEALQRQKAVADTEEAYGEGDKKQRDDRLKEISAVFEMNTGPHSNYARKLYLIENCIYGIDIKPIAIQITKLRFFISLIVDQKTGGAKESNYNVLPLPNLETKFVATNTLLGLKRETDVLADPEIEEKQKELLIIRHKHFSARRAKEKIALRERDYKLSQQLTDLLEKDHFYNSDDAELMAKWNPYSQIKPSNFFDSWWMFGIKDGFDVVIGNPPYIQLQNNHGKLAEIYKKSGYESFSRSGDIYQLFCECGYKLLKEKGHLCLITSNKWMRAAYGEKTRTFFANNANTKILIDFSGQKVFESATVDVNIILIEKSKNKQATLGCIIKEDCKTNMTDYIRQHGTKLEFPTGDSWVILNSIEKRIKEKIERAGKPLKDWDISINYGIKTGCNEAFIINKNKRDELVAKDPKSVEIIHPILRGRDIKRYGYEFADQYIIATFPSRKYDIDEYPAIRDYLLDFGKKRLEQSGKPGARKKTTHKWFETQDPIAYWDV
jgi:tRNA1(Val) A37 N6-methylase TrmN6